MRPDDLDLASQVEQALLTHRDGKVHRGGREIKFRCPVHDDRHPSASYNREHGVWTCYACDAGGGLTWGDHELAALIGFAPLEPWDEQELARRRLIAQEQREEAEARQKDALAAYWREHRLIERLREHEDVLERLKRQGIGRLAAEHFEFGYDRYYSHPALVIPWKVQDKLRAIQYRLLQTNEGGRYRWHEGSEPTLFNADAVITPEDDTILVVEGAKKAAALWSHGLTSVCALVNKNAWSESYAPPFRSFERVVFVPDPDAVDMAHEWAATVPRSRVAVLPEKPDDLLVHTDGDVDLMWRYIETAKEARKA